MRLSVQAMVAAVVLGACAPQVKEPAPAPALSTLVNPRIGTGGFGFAYGAGFLGAAVPHGMVKVGPDTTGNFGESRFVHTSGHWSEDPTILCFSHTHLHGVGVPDGGAVAMMPTTSFGPARPQAVRSQATRIDEVVDVAGYRVRLEEPDILVELAATTRAAHHRYTFPDGTTDATVVLDLARVITEGEVKTATLTQTDATTLEGSMHMEGSLSPPGGYVIFFVVVADSPFDVTASTVDAAPATLPLTSPVVRAALRFGARDTQTPVQLRVALSLTDLDGARGNLAAELPAFGHEDVVARARADWARQLDVVRVFGGESDDHVQLASALYRLFLLPSVLNDVDGRYAMGDGSGSGAVHNVSGHRMMTDLSLWDTYRSVQPLYALLAPESGRDVALSLVEFVRRAGFMPLWTMATGDSNVMIGAPGESTVGDAVARGVIAGADVQDVWPTLRHAALDTASEPAAGRQGRRDTDVYDRLGYVPTTRRASVSSTLEYHSNDLGLATIADAVGAVDDAARLRARAAGWQLLFDESTGFLRGRDEAGAFRPLDGDFDPTDFGADYVEASAWQSTFPLDDVTGMEAVYGGRAGVLDKLSELLSLTEADWQTRDPSSELFGVNPLPFHWQGNEPSLHVSALPYDLADRDLGRRFVTFVRTTQYHSRDDGVPGNDDGGATSAWLVSAMLGLHPVPGGDAWVVGAPLFPRVEVDTAVGTLVITRDDVDIAAETLATITLDDAPVTETRVPHTALLDAALHVGR